MKKGLSFSIVIAMMVVLLTGCKETQLQNYETEGGRQYEEWANHIGLTDKKFVDVTSYSQQDDQIDIIVDVGNDTMEEDLRNISELIRKHNDFVDDNPDYFSEYANITLDVRHGSSKPLFIFYSNYGSVQDNQTLDLSPDAKFTFIKMDPSSIPDRIVASDVLFDTPVTVIPYSIAYANSGYGNYDCVKLNSGSRKLILDLSNDDPEKLDIGYLTDMFPGEEMYYSVSGNNIAVLESK